MAKSPKLNGKQVLADADQNGLLFPIKPGWRKYMIFAGVLMCLLIITIPLGIWFFVMAGKCRLGMNDEGFAVKWFTTNAYRWDDIEAFRPAPLSFNVHIAGGGLVGGLIAGVASAAASSAVAKRTAGINGPVSFKLKGKRMWLQFPAHAIQNSVEMAREMERRTGLEILPPAEPAPVAEAPAA
ncbi:MAG: hypothetical protein H6745_27970 [Deltaproteobacteria bacterium]|nr:hypothetical protein [Deltaproteobacteria bacterium]